MLLYHMRLKLGMGGMHTKIQPSEEPRSSRFHSSALLQAEAFT